MMDHGKDDPSDKRAKSYKVGYGKPPSHTQFAKGRSGNPNGRPRGTKNKPVDLQGWGFRDDFLREAGRQVPGQQEGSLTMMQATVRRTFADAIRGRARAQELILRQMAQFSSADQALEAEFIKSMMEAKASGEMELARRARLGLKNEPELVPHPDDILIDPETGTVSVRGLYSEEERKRSAALRAHAEVLRAYLAQLAEMIAAEKSAAGRKAFKELRSEVQTRLDDVENALS